MTQNGRCSYVSSPSSDTDQKTQIHYGSSPTMSNRNGHQVASMAAADKDDKDEMPFYTVDSGSEKRKTPSFFQKLKIFLQVICASRSCRNILLIGVMFAVLSGCSMSSVIVFIGRIKHVLLNNAPATTSFLKGTYEQVIILASVTAFTIVTNFAMHMSITVLGDKMSVRLKRRYDGWGNRVCNQIHLRHEINSELVGKIDLIEKGSANFEMLCRSAATIISSLIICFYHEARLTVVTLGVIPFAVTLDVLSKRLSKKSDALLSNKLAQITQMEKEMLLLKDSDDNTTNDERLMRLSVELRNCTRHAILHQIWNSSYYGVLCFVVFTFVGCGMLYGGFLLDEENDDRIGEGDVFIVVLSMALIASSISVTTGNYKACRKGVNAALFIKNLEQLEHGLLRTQNGNQRNSLVDDNITVTLITPVEFKKPITVPSAENPFIRFTNGSKSVLRNYHNHKMFLLLGFILAVIHGLEQPAYNVIMGRVFMAMLDDRPDIRDLTLCAIQFSAVGFGVFVSRTLSAILAAVASEHMAVSFRVILARHLLKRIDKQSFSKSEISRLVDENLSLATDAKSLYHPHAPELISRITSVITNIVLGFVFSWEIALLGLIFIVLCLIAQIEMEFEILSRCCKFADSQRVQQGNIGLLKPCKTYIFKAANFSIVQTSGFVLKTICYALTAYICNHGYKHQAQAFMSVITLFSAIRDAVKLPDLFVDIRKSWHAVHRIFACMYSRPSRSNISSISETIRL